MTFSYRAAPGVAKRPPLDRAAIVRAALELLDEVGLDELTMRRVADRLGTKAASLYRHVRDKDELLALLAEEISGAIPVPVPMGTWQDRLRAMAQTARHGLLSRRDAARLLATTQPIGQQRLHLIEAILAILRSAGLSPRAAARTAYHVNNAVTAFAADAARFAPAGPQREAAALETRRAFESLPASEFPTVNELAGELADDDPDALFDFVIETWIADIERRVRRDKEASAGRRRRA